MFVFVENLAGLHIVTHCPELASRRLIKFATPYVMSFAEPAFRRNGWVVSLQPPWLRVLKPLLSLLQLPVIQQDPYALAFKLGIWKQVLSDGLLTEFIVKHLKAPVKRFYSLTSAQGGRSQGVAGCAIIGSNWLEFGSMSRLAYRAHLEFLQQSYPEALYYCHPKEGSELPEQVFGATHVRRPDRPVEALLRAQGIPERLVGVCSSSLLALSVGGTQGVRVDLVCLEPQQFDGKNGDKVYTFSKPSGGRSSVRVADLQAFLVQELASCQVQVQQVQQPLAAGVA